MNEKTVKKLHDKKYREALGMFLVQGEKSILEALVNDMDIAHVFSTKKFLPLFKHVSCSEVSEEQLRAMSTLETNTSALAVVRQRDEITIEEMVTTSKGNFLVIDTIRDPGNFGTIVRTADWFGITDIICSPTTVDFYNPKVISATMGSFTRATVCYTDLEKALVILKQTTIATYGCVMDGENIHTVRKEPRRCVVLGSESHGISYPLLSHIDYKVTIPKASGSGGESLNVGVAAGIALSVLS